MKIKELEKRGALNELIVAFSKKNIDEDFNPKGVFFGTVIPDTEELVTVKWNPFHDFWKSHEIPVEDIDDFYFAEHVGDLK